jgi:Nucleotidyl transferase AbiEii toxin, Type IV TA system
MANSSNPEIRLAEKVLPSALYRSLCHVFAQGISGCVLAGGTALAGFYAGHRRSDDLDLFTATESAQRSAVLAVKSLTSIGVILDTVNESAQYFEGIGKLDSHLFKMTVVLDSNLFRVGTSVSLAGNIHVVDLDTLFKMKAATLVSRCSEKDLYDLIWLLGRYPDRKFEDLIRLGNEIDAGVRGEAVLGSVSGAILRKEACNFSLDFGDSGKKSGQIYEEILAFRQNLLRGLAVYLENEPTPELGELVRGLEKLRKR